MPLTSIAAIACQIQTQPGWEGVRDWGLVVTAWSATVSPAIAERTQPRAFARGVLTIATNSSSLAHQLTFGRQALCQQLNIHLVGSIDELRFVAVGYNSSQRSTPTAIALDSVPIDSGEIAICSRCDCRARQGELLRWRVCQFCAIDLGLIGGKLRIKS